MFPYFSLSQKKKKHSNLLGKLNDLCYFEEKRIPQQKIKRRKSYVYYCLFPHQLQFCQHPPISGLLESQIFSTLAIWLMNIGLMLSLTSVVNSVESMTMRPKLYLDVLKMEHRV